MTVTSCFTVFDSFIQDVYFFILSASTVKFRFDTMSESNQLKGPDAKYIKIISSDNHEFIIKKDVALTSGDIEVSRVNLILNKVR